MDEDTLLAATLAATSDKFIKDKWGGSRDLNNIYRNRTDPRKFLSKDQQHQLPPPQQQNILQQIPMQENFDNLAVSTPRLLELPKNANGQVIVPPELIPNQTPVQQPQGLQTSGFQIPDYNKKEQSAINDKLDSMIEELKVIKKTNAKLLRIIQNLNQIVSNLGVKPEMDKEEISI